MTIRQAIKNGFLPEVDPSKEAEFINVLKKIISDVDVLDYKLKTGELDKIIFSSKINNYFIAQEIKKAHGELLNDYTNIINEYGSIVKDIKEKSINLKGKDLKYIEAEKKEIESLIKELEKQKTEHGKNITNFDRRYNELMIDREDLKFNIKEGKEIDRELESQYKELAKQQAEASKYTTRRMKRDYKKKIEETQKCIKALQEKKAAIQIKQRQIINKNTGKYTRIQNKKIRKITANIDRLKIHSEAEMKSRQIIQEYKEGLALTEKEINNLQRKSGIANKFKLMSANSTKRQINRKLRTLEFKRDILDRLKDKKGLCNFSQQLYKYVTDVLASENTFKR